MIKTDIIENKISEMFDYYLEYGELTDEQIQGLLDSIRINLNLDNVQIIESDTDNSCIYVSYVSNAIEGTDMLGIKIPTPTKDGRIIRSHYDADGLSEKMLGNPQINMQGSMLHSCLMHRNIFHGILGIHTPVEKYVWTKEEKRIVIRASRLLTPFLTNKHISSAINDIQREAEQKDLLSEAIPGGFKIWRDDKEGTITYLAESIAIMQGYSIPDFFEHCKGSNFLNIHPEDRALVRKEIEKEISESGSYKVKYRVICKDGSYKWAMDIGKRTLDDSGKVAYHSIVSDITKSEEQERLLARERRRYRDSLLANAEFSYELDLTDGMLRNEIIMKDGKPMVGYVNESLPIHYDDLCRLSMEAIKVKLLDEKTAVYWTRQGLLNAFARGEVNAECEYYSELDDKFYRNSALMSLDETNGHIYAIMMCVDITELKKEQERNKKQLEAAYEEANKANQAKSDFLSSMSHEIRTPMNAIVGLTDSLLRKDLPEDVIEYLSNIKSSGKALLNIINDLLDFSKIESGKFVIVPQDYDLYQLIKDIEIIGQNRIGEKGIQLRFEIDPKLPRNLNGDSQRIRQVLINIMNNAIKFTDNGSVTVGIKIEDKIYNKVKIHFSVSDTGIGIKQEDIAQLFDPFSQADLKKNAGKEGTGLGLAISQNLVMLMGGDKINVTSEYNKGSTFSYSLWQDYQDETPIGEYGTATSGELDKSQVDFSFTTKGLEMLIVDDNRINQMVAVAILEPLEANFDLADDGEDAIQMVQKKQYDIILMDHYMPGKNGVDATKEIRALDGEYFKKVPIIALTADAIQSNQHIFIEAGMNDIITKPIEIKNAEVVLKKWIPKHFIQTK